MQSDIDQSAENEALKARIAELEAKIEKLERLADSDTLTPLPNRRFFFRAVERAIAQRGRHGTPAAVLFIDVDGLKHINDAHGHGVGDQALIHTAWVLREKIRSSDVVARIGGDEYGVLLEYADEAGAHEKASALEAAVAGSPLHGRIALTASIGVTALEPGDTPETALARADSSMYDAKRRRG
ncbi:GGDEF domain-containing protein [Sphingomonas tabacisoli]|uniref:diguanylate cyclase n=1 Tax=Sphingomonas tabacisoli TaxID=2249466 RepID=A0ABW4I0R8_9SPHN